MIKTFYHSSNKQKMQNHDYMISNNESVLKTVSLNFKILIVIRIQFSMDYFLAARENLGREKERTKIDDKQFV